MIESFLQVLRPGHFVRRESNSLRALRAEETLTSGKSFFEMTDHLAFDRASIDAGEALFHRGCEQWNVRNFAKIFGDEPDRFFRCHPVLAIEAREVHRARVSAQGAFAAQVEVNIEIGHGQLAEIAIHGLAITAAGEI